MEHARCVGQRCIGTSVKDTTTFTPVAAKRISRRSWREGLARFEWNIVSSVSGGAALGSTSIDSNPPSGLNLPGPSDLRQSLKGMSPLIRLSFQHHHPPAVIQTPIKSVSERPWSAMKEKLMAAHRRDSSPNGVVNPTVTRLPCTMLFVWTMIAKRKSTFLPLSPQPPGLTYS